MGEVERFNPYGCSMIDKPNGEWVRYSDYADLTKEADELDDKAERALAENRRLRERVDQNFKSYEVVKEESNRLSTENQQLREVLKLIADDGELDCPCVHYANEALKESGVE